MNIVSEDCSPELNEHHFFVKTTEEMSVAANALLGLGYTVFAAGDDDGPSRVTIALNEREAQDANMARGVIVELHAPK